MLALVEVTPYVGVWIEIPGRTVQQSQLTSPPMWGCGLKLHSLTLNWITFVSPPMWGCGLKFLVPFRVEPAAEVTPYVGVWIEINSRKY